MSRRFALLALTVAVAGSGASTVAAGPVLNGKIAFTTFRAGSFEIFVMNADGSAQTNLTNHPLRDQAPAWSPDGRKIAFERELDPTGSSVPGNYEIFVMDADGSGQTNLTNHPAIDGLPAWSPDGTKIAFYTLRTGNTEIFVMNADGSGQTNLSNHTASDAYPAWSPDGTKIAFSSDRTGDYEIFVMNADGSAQAALTTNGVHDHSPAWSPDGTRIAFTRRGGNDEVFVMNADGSGQTNLTNTAGIDDRPAWSPDGTKIAFDTQRTGNLEVFVMDPDGSRQTNLTNDPGTDWDPAWQPVPIPAPFVSSAKAREGKPARFTITLPMALPGPVTYEYATIPGKARPGKDFKRVQGSVTFAPGERAKVVKTKTRQDVRDEKRETFFLDVSYPGVPSGRGTAKIKDND